MLERPNSFINLLANTLSKVVGIMGGTESKKNIILVLSDYKQSNPLNVSAREKEAIDLELAGSIRWESVDISPEERKSQIKKLIELTDS